MTFRITRDSLYPIGSLGHRDLTARQGYYIEAETIGQCILVAKLKFPNEPLTIEHYSRSSGELTKV